MATLLLVFVFLLSVFILAQFFLGQEVTNKDTVLYAANAQLAELTDLLSLEKSGSRDLQETLATLQANLATSEGERDRLQGLLDSRQCCGRGSDGQDRRARERPRQREADEPARAGAGGAPEPADLGAASPARSAGGGAERLRERATRRARPRSPTSATG